MYLHTKFLAGLGFLISVGIGSFILGPFFLPQFGRGEFYVLLGVSIIGVGIFYSYLLFASERIRGFQAEYETKPDLTEFRVVKTYNRPNPSLEEIPEIAYCGSCGNQVHKPFRCNLCGQYLCGKHYLKGDHICINEE
ncbi:MAG: hypothetical protein ACFFE8_06015 [Candidatus Heimdallarchaeota archaeon]